jgi:hypothetical protein
MRAIPDRDCTPHISAMFLAGHGDADQRNGQILILQRGRQHRTRGPADSKGSIHSGEAM